MKKTVYLHIGRPKVGSSSLQHFLHNNAEALLQQGCLYPRTGRVHEGNHHVSVEHGSHQLALVFLPGLMYHDLVRDVDTGKLYGALLEEIEQSTVASAIISSENFWFVDPHQLPASFRAAVDIRILCYMRRQDDVALSSFVQEVSLGQIAFDCDLSEYLEVPERLRLLDYAGILRPWAEVFGDASIDARVYEEFSSVATIEVDLLRELGLDPDDSRWRYDRVRRNPSLPLDALQVISELQVAAGAFADCAGIADPLRETAAAIAAISGREGGVAHGELFSLERRAALLDRFAASNAEVARRYLGRQDGRLFPALIGVPGQTPPPDIAFARYRTLIASIIAAQHSAIEGLKRDNSAMQERLEQLGGAQAVLARELSVTNQRVSGIPLHNHPLLFRLERILNAFGLARLKAWRQQRRVGRG